MSIAYTLECQTTKLVPFFVEHRLATPNVSVNLLIIVST